MTVAGHFGVDQSTVCRTIWKVSNAIIDTADSFMIPANSKEEWFNHFGLPNIIGAIDGSHIEIKQPNSDFFPISFINRKSYYSINVQIICDTKGKIINLIPTWPGSVHDSRVTSNLPNKRRVYRQSIQMILNKLHPSRIIYIYRPEFGRP